MDEIPSRDQEPFWRRKSLGEMSQHEWESLCDGCGRCCLVKLENESTGEVVTTDYACFLLDLHTCRCGDYAQRQKLVSTCLHLTPQRIRELPWLPDTCAYVKVDRGEDLDWWHPLVSGDPDAVHRAGISVRGRARPETEMIDWEDELARIYEQK